MLWPDLALVPPAEVAKAAAVGPRVIYRMIRAGRLEGRKIGKHWRVPRAAALALLGIADPAPLPQASPRRERLSRREEATVRSFLGG